MATGRGPRVLNGSDKSTSRNLWDFERERSCGESCEPVVENAFKEARVPA
jgi:hypothetical protein